MFSIAPIRCGVVVCFTMLQWTFFWKCFCLKGKYSQLFGYCKGGTSWLRYSSTLDIGKIWKWGVITTFESVCLLFNKSIEANSVDPDQTASRWAVCSRSTVTVFFKRLHNISIDDSVVIYALRVNKCGFSALTDRAFMKCTQACAAQATFKRLTNR